MPKTGRVGPVKLRQPVKIERSYQFKRAEVRGRVATRRIKDSMLITVMQAVTDWIGTMQPENVVHDVTLEWTYEEPTYDTAQITLCAYIRDRKKPPKGKQK